jgi:hypothetical protein
MVEAGIRTLNWIPWPALPLCNANLFYFYNMCTSFSESLFATDCMLIGQQMIRDVQKLIPIDLHGTGI